MALIRWTPARSNDLITFRNDLDRLFDPFAQIAGRRSTGMLTPPVDIEETPEAFLFHMDLPGVQPADVKVTVTSDTLSIRGERKSTSEQRTGDVHRSERSHGMFERTFQLATPVRTDGVEATYRDGVLAVKVAKAEAARMREVEVKVG